MTGQGSLIHSVNIYKGLACAIGQRALDTAVNKRGKLSTLKETHK